MFGVIGCVLLKCKTKDYLKKKHKEEYATNYTKHATILVDDVMRRPSTWIGIPNQPEGRKQQELTKIQENVDGITKSLIEVASSGEIDFAALESLSKNQRSNYRKR